MDTTFKLQHYNVIYLSGINSPYQHFLQTRYDSNVAILDAMAYTGSLPGHFEDRLNLINDDQMYIIDMAPFILSSVQKDPALLYTAILSPTFSVSLFDVKQDSVHRSLEDWSKRMERLHLKLLQAIKENKNAELPEDLDDIYMTYQTSFDRDHPINKEPISSYFLSIALMDIYHIYHGKIYHEKQYLNFHPDFLIRYDAPEFYCKKYSIFFQSEPVNYDEFRIDQRVVPKDFFNKMKEDVLDSRGINIFLQRKNMRKVLRSRMDAINVYNKISYKISINYINYLTRVIQTSPAINNKEEFMTHILRFRSNFHPRSAALSFIIFVNLIQEAIGDNLTNNNWPFLFKHSSDAYSPIPPILS